MIMRVLLVGSYSRELRDHTVLKSGFLGYVSRDLGVSCLLVQTGRDWLFCAKHEGDPFIFQTGRSWRRPDSVRRTGW